jgi:ubiquinone/menaquinone biosynthesis C-methylase UbiE
VKKEQPASEIQKKFDFSPPRPRPFLTNLPARIDTYEEGVANFFRWRTGLEYYATVDQVVDFVINTGRSKVVDLLTDTGILALRLAGRKTFLGRVYSFDDNVTLLERARQRARHLNLERTVEFRGSENAVVPVADGFCELAMSFFDFHRHPAKQFLSEAVRILTPEGHLILAEVLEPKTARNIWKSRFRSLDLRWLKKNPAEAQGVYYDKEEMIQMLFESGFCQVIIQELKGRSSPHQGVFSLIAATK